MVAMKQRISWDALTPRWTRFRSHAAQRALWTCRKRFVAVPAGRGSGKTELAKRRLVRMLAVQKEWSSPRYFYGAPTEQQAWRIAWEDLIALTPPNWIRRISLGAGFIESKWGVRIYVVGLDKPQRIEGLQWDGCVIDESSDIKPGVFTLNVGPALNHRRGWAWRIGVPKRQGVGAKEYREFAERAQSGVDQEMQHFTWPSSDILSAEQLQFWKERLDPKDYREQYEACWETSGGGIFHAFDRSYNVRPCAYDPSLPIVVGQDFNVDPMCWVVGHVYKRERIEWFDELWEQDTNTVRCLDILHRRYESHRAGWQFFGDASGNSRRSSARDSDIAQIGNHPGFRAAGRTMHYERSNPGVEDRFSACNAMFCNAAMQRRMYVDPSCKRLIDDIEARHYEPGTRIVQDGHDLGHMTDAMGYVVHALFPVVSIRSRKPQLVTIESGRR